MVQDVCQYNIRKQSILLEVDSEQLALKLQAGISDINRNKILPLINKILNEFSIAGQTIKIKKINVDIGTFSANSFETMFEQRFEQAFRSSLHDVLYNKNKFQHDNEEDGRNVKNENVKFEDDLQTQLKIFEYYLSKGTLPWYAHKKNNFCFEKIFLILIDEDFSTVIDIIKKHNYQLVIPRIVFQLEKKSLYRLVQLLEPKHNALIIRYIKTLSATHHNEKILLMDAKKFDDLIWTLTLTYSINERGSQFNRQSFIKSILLGIAQKEDTEYFKVLNALSLSINSSNKKLSLSSSLPGIINKLVDEHQQTIEHMPNQNEFVVQEQLGQSNAVDNNIKIEQSLFYLETYLSQGHLNFLSLPKYVMSVSINNDFSNIVKLISRHAKLQAREMIHRLANQANLTLPILVERLLKIFSSTDLLSILVNKDYVLIESWIKLLISYNKKTFKKNKTIKNNEKFVWESILQHLISQASTAWQAKTIVANTIYFMAEYIGVSSFSLALELKYLLGGKVSSPINLALAQALKEIKNKSGDEILNFSFDFKNELFQSYDKIEIIQYYLWYGVLPWKTTYQNKKIKPVDFLSHLSLLPRYQLYNILTFSNANVQLTMLYRLINVLPENIVIQLIKNLLPKKQVEQSSLIKSILSFASQAKNKNAFYIQLLSDLLLENLIDLDALSKNNIFISDPRKNEPIEQWEEHLLQSKIIEFLYHNNYPTKNPVDINSLLIVFFSKKPSNVRYFITTIYENSNVVSKLLKNISTKVFIQLISILQPKINFFLNQLIHILNDSPVSYRPSEVVLRKSVLSVVLFSNEKSFEQLFLKIIKETFNCDFSKPLKEYLLSSIKKLSVDKDISIEMFDYLENAIIEVEKKSNSNLTKKQKSIDKITLYDVEKLNHVFVFLSKNKIKNDTLKFDQLEPLSEDLIINYLYDALTKPPEKLISFIKNKVKTKNVYEFWSNTLPDNLLVRFIGLLMPQKASLLLEYMDILMSAWNEHLSENNFKKIKRHQFWMFIFQFYNQYRLAGHTLKNITVDFFDYFSVCMNVDLFVVEEKIKSLHYEENTIKENDLECLIIKILNTVKKLAINSGQNQLTSFLSNDSSFLLKFLNYSAEKQKKQTKKIFDNNKKEVLSVEQEKNIFNFEDDIDVGDCFYLNNAGLILVGAFLPHLFKSLDMLVVNQEGKTYLRNEATITRAIHILQHLVDGSTSTPEPLLILNKLMCGQMINTPVDQSIELTEQELTICEQLFKAMINQWQAISDTSIEGVQQTFMQREGRLVRTDDGWKLTIQRNTVDVLIDQVSWRLSIISEAWMPEPIFVEW